MCNCNFNNYCIVIIHNYILSYGLPDVAVVVVK